MNEKLLKAVEDYIREFLPEKYKFKTLKVTDHPNKDLIYSILIIDTTDKTKNTSVPLFKHDDIDTVKEVFHDRYETYLE